MSKFVREILTEDVHFGWDGGWTLVSLSESAGKALNEAMEVQAYPFIEGIASWDEGRAHDPSLNIVNFARNLEAISEAIATLQMFVTPVKID